MSPGWNVLTLKKIVNMWIFFGYTIVPHTFKEACRRRKSTAIFCPPPPFIFYLAHSCGFQLCGRWPRGLCFLTAVYLHEDGAWAAPHYRSRYNKWETVYNKYDINKNKLFFWCRFLWRSCLKWKSLESHRTCATTGRKDMQCDAEKEAPVVLHSITSTWNVDVRVVY